MDTEDKKLTGSQTEGQKPSNTETNRKLLKFEPQSTKQTASHDAETILEDTQTLDVTASESEHTTETQESSLQDSAPEQKLTSSEIEAMLKEAEAVHTPRRTTKPERKKKKNIRWDMIIALVVAVVLIAGVVGLVKHFAGKVGSTTTQTAKDNPLVEEKYPEISDVVKNYMEAFLIEDAQKRVEILAQYVDNMGDISDVSQKNYIAKYSDIECYTKEGPYENTYIVYAYYQMKLKNISTSVPSLDRYYVIRDSQTGNVYIHNGISSDIQKYIDEVEQDEDVQNLIADVKKELQETIDSDDALESFYEKLMQQSADSETQNGETTVEETAAADTTKAEE